MFGGVWRYVRGQREGMWPRWSVGGMEQESEVQEGGWMMRKLSKVITEQK